MCVKRGTKKNKIILFTPSGGSCLFVCFFHFLYIEVVVDLRPMQLTAVQLYDQIGRLGKQERASESEGDAQQFMHPEGSDSPCHSLWEANLEPFLEHMCLKHHHTILNLTKVQLTTSLSEPNMVVSR